MTMSMLRRSTLVLTGVSLAAALAGCGGGGGDEEAPRAGTQAPQCADTGTCPAQGPVTIGGPPGSLCPAALDYSTTFTGGSGAGELVKLRFDTAARTYQLEIIESPVPKQPGSVSPTRAGVTFTGTFANMTSLPTAEQNRCAVALQTATASDGTSQANIDSAKPPVIFLGNGVAGGGIPGATISYPGVLGLGAIPATTFPFYPVLAFAQTETDFTRVAGNYNLLGYHQVPSGGSLTSSSHFTPATAQTTETLNADGSCTVAAGSCLSTGNSWKLRSADGAFESSNADGSRRYPSFQSAAITSNNASRAKGLMVVGKLNGALVPLLVRTGYAQISLLPLTVNVDDESGLALMAPAKALASGQLDGGYIGSGSDFVYTASLVKGARVELLDPMTMNQSGAFQLDFTQNAPGMIATTDNSGTAGALIASGRVFSHLSGTGSASPTFRVGVLAAP
ncbi:hypothetical protein CF68_23555 [Cupriavidus sp. SK-4]|uniref:DUF2957 domain-containing protein n=1 Tax=Cupriavidus sp. SK-4 TaxID=574750 RepID=UPI00044D1CD2|nr:DUF2957 domain-containing protein [Cupriavidus sp. SK-4]EYS95390.1 hypothetical protein CF68_23555 [Cupriavidus sp. SK-4]